VNIWVTGTYVVELRDSDGAQLGLFDVGSPTSTGVAFDGANIWWRSPSRIASTKCRPEHGCDP